MTKAMKFHHIGIAAENIEEKIEYLKTLFDIVDISETVYDENQDATLCMLTMSDGTNIELISGNAVNSYTKKRIYLYHTCFETNNLIGTIDEFVKNGALMISEPKEAILFDNKRVAFLMTQMGLVELLEVNE